jgi:anti-anti-sigma factor
VDLELELTKRNGYAVLAVHGELDIGNASELRARLRELIDQGYRHLVVDLEEMTLSTQPAWRPRQRTQTGARA